LNNTTLLGRLTKDVDLRYTQTGTAVGNFTLAVNRPFKNKETNEYEADFIRCVVCGKTAETIANHVKKGHQLAVEGRIQTGSYENKEGERVYKTDVVVNGFTFVESRQKRESQPSENAEKSNVWQEPHKESPFAEDGEPIQIRDTDLPF